MMTIYQLYFRKRYTCFVAEEEQIYLFQNSPMESFEYMTKNCSYVICVTKSSRACWSKILYMMPYWCKELTFYVQMASLQVYLKKHVIKSHFPHKNTPTHALQAFNRRMEI